MLTQMQTPNNSLIFFFLLICHPLYGLIGNTPWNWSQKCEKAVCAAKCTLTSATAVLAHFDPEFPVELSVDASIWFGCRYSARLFKWKLSHVSQTLNEHDKAFSYGIRFVPSKRNAVADALSRLPLPSAFNEEDATYRVEERLVHSLAITHKEIRDATQVDPVLSRALEFFKQGCPQYVEDLRLQPFFNRQIELSVEQDCLLCGLRVINPTRFKEEWLEELHTGHPGILRTKETARTYFWWPNIDQKIE